MVREVSRFGEFDLDRVAYKLRQKGSVVPPSPYRWTSSLYSSEKPGELLTRDQIYQRIWGKNDFLDSENAINTAIMKVRRALNHDARTTPS